MRIFQIFSTANDTRFESLYKKRNVFSESFLFKEFLALYSGLSRRNQKKIEKLLQEFSNREAAKMKLLRDAEALERFYSTADINLEDLLETAHEASQVIRALKAGQKLGILSKTDSRVSARLLEHLSAQCSKSKEAKIALKNSGVLHVFKGKERKRSLFRLV